MARIEQLSKTLKTLVNNTPDIEGAALIDNDGLMIASSLDAETDDDSVAAMSAALLGLSERISAELARGDFELVMLKGGSGYAVLVRCGPDAVLTIMATPTAKMGLIFLDVKRAGVELARALG